MHFLAHAMTGSADLGSLTSKRLAVRSETRLSCGMRDVRLIQLVVYATLKQGSSVSRQFVTGDEQMTATANAMNVSIVAHKVPHPAANYHYGIFSHNVEGSRAPSGGTGKKNPPRATSS